MAQTTSKTLTTRDAIDKFIKSLHRLTDDEVNAHASLLIKFKPITDKAWRQRNGRIAEMTGDALQPEWLSWIVLGTVETFRISDLTCMEPEGDDGWIFLHRDNVVDLRVTAAHIASLTVSESPIVSEPPPSYNIDGLTNPMTPQPSGEVRVGCQTLTRKGCEQAFKVLADHLGYTLTG